MKKNVLVSIIFLLGFTTANHAQNNIGSYDDLAPRIIASAKSRDLICLGEKSHGDMNVHYVKTRILRDLVEHEPVAAIIFEAPLVTSVMAYLKNESYADFVWPFWKYEGLRPSLDSITGAPGMICLGFDPQETCDFMNFSSFLLDEGYLENHTELTKMDSLLAIAIYTSPDQETRKLTTEEAGTVEGLVEELRLNLAWPTDATPIQKALINLCLDNRGFLATEMTFHRYKDQINFRDSVMALNIQSIKEIFDLSNHDKKVVIWAANLHIARKWNSKETYMMERYIRDNPDRVLSIGIIPRKRKRESGRYDFAIINKPVYMSAGQMVDYDCK